MSELTKTRRPIHAADEGYDQYRTNPSSTRRYQQTQEPVTGARRVDRVPSRASRPAVRTAPVRDDVYGEYDGDAMTTQDDPIYVQRAGTNSARPTSDVYYPPRVDIRSAREQTHYPEYDRTRARRDEARMRSFATADVADDTESPLPPQRYNRRQRRRSLPLGEVRLVQWFCKILVAAAILYILGSLAFTFYMTHIGDPMAYGPEHGNVITLHDGSQEYYLQGLNNHGQTEIIEIPVGHPNTSKIYLGPSGGPTNADANVHLEMKDINHDGHADIIEHIEPEGFHWLFTPQPSNDFVFLNDSHDQFKLQQSNQGGE